MMIWIVYDSHSNYLNDDYFLLSIKETISRHYERCAEHVITFIDTHDIGELGNVDAWVPTPFKLRRAS